MIRRNNYLLNLYRYGRKMLITTFKNKNIEKGVFHSLFLTKIFTESEDVLLYKQNETGVYGLSLNALMAKKDYSYDNTWITIFVNMSQKLYENHDVKIVDCSDIYNGRDLTLIPLKINNNKYVLIIRDSNIHEEVENKEFIYVLRENMSVILEKLEDFNKLKEDVNIDKLTGLKSRNAYEDVVIKLDDENDDYIYAIFDLFRLKYVNDNYDHFLGDTYIIKATEILRKYFPENYTYKDKYGVLKEGVTGSCVYRIGGDEFALIAKHESLTSIRSKLILIQEEMSKIDLGVHEDLHLAINYGIGVRANKETFEEVVLIAGKELKDDKKEMYSRLGIERRNQDIKK